MTAARYLAILPFALVLYISPAQGDEPAKSAKTETKAAKESQDNKENKKNWKPLFDGKTLKGWKVSDFYGESEVGVKEGAIVMKPGAFMAGVTATQKIPNVNYEVSLEAQRVEGSDFFCGLTFPVEEEFCSLIVGGWGGGVVGLSSLNGMDASENETTTYREFENGKWFPIKLRVTDERITAWIDDEEMVDVDIEESELSTRLEVEWSKPFGVASWSTTGAIRNVKIRQLPPDEVKGVNDANLDEQ